MTDSIRRRVASRIRTLRSAQNISLSELARSSGIAKATLSKIESGEANPTLDTLWQLSNALKVPASRLMEEPEPETALVRADEGQHFSEAAIRGRLLRATDTGPVHLEIYQGTFLHDIPHHSPGHRLGVMEHIMVNSGQLRVRTESGEHLLGTGDYLYVRTDEPHSYQAMDGDAQVTLIMEYKRD